ncbi:MAG: hypothetical protein AAGK21_14190 [Bacteroidota bacterium]
MLAALGWILLAAALVSAGVVALRWQRALSASAPQAAPTTAQDDLSSLGLSEVRSVDPARASQPRPVAGQATATPVPASESPAGDGEWESHDVRLLLRSLAAHVASPVSVVRPNGDHYVIAARTDGGDMDPIAGHDLTLEAPAVLSAGDLGPLAALVGGSAHAVPHGDHLILVGGRDHHATAEAVSKYVGVIEALVPASASEVGHDADRHDDDRHHAAPHDLEEPASAGDPDIDESAHDDEPPRDEGAGHEPRPLPRAEIIRMEQAAALDDGRPLAFALVTLADAEERLTTHTPEDVAVASSALRDRLEDADHVRRVEPFGDLLFGAFIDCDPTGAAGWCQELSASDPPLFIGAVAPADGDPQAVREAATTALRDAYDKKRAHVVEV